MKKITWSHRPNKLAHSSDDFSRYPNHERGVLIYFSHLPRELLENRTQIVNYTLKWHLKERLNLNLEQGENMPMNTSKDLE